MRIPALINQPAMGKPRSTPAFPVLAAIQTKSDAHGRRRKPIGRVNHLCVGAYPTVDTAGKVTSVINSAYRRTAERCGVVRPGDVERVPFPALLVLELPLRSETRRRRASWHSLAPEALWEVVSEVPWIVAVELSPSQIVLPQPFTVAFEPVPRGFSELELPETITVELAPSSSNCHFR
jgi:hypothetical protein